MVFITNATECIVFRNVLMLVVFLDMVLCVYKRYGGQNMAVDMGDSTLENYSKPADKTLYLRIT